MKKMRYLKSMHDPFLTNVITELLLQIIPREIKKKQNLKKEVDMKCI
jgi:hypothetical protein